VSKIIVDANIIFSALLSGQNRIRDTLLYDAKSPQIIINPLQKH